MNTALVTAISNLKNLFLDTYQHILCWSPFYSDNFEHHI